MSTSTGALVVDAVSKTFETPSGATQILRDVSFEAWPGDTIAIADHGLENVFASDAGLRKGVVTARGRCLHPLVAERFDVPFCDPAELFGTVGATHDGR